MHDGTTIIINFFCNYTYCSYFFTITQVTLQLEEGTPSDPVGRFFFLKLGKRIWVVSIYGLVLWATPLTEGDQLLVLSTHELQYNQIAAW